MLSGGANRANAVCFVQQQERSPLYLHLGDTPHGAGARVNDLQPSRPSGNLRVSQRQFVSVNEPRGVLFYFFEFEEQNGAKLISALP